MSTIGGLVEQENRFSQRSLPSSKVRRKASGVRRNLFCNTGATILVQVGNLGFFEVPCSSHTRSELLRWTG